MRLDKQAGDEVALHFIKNFPGKTEIKLSNKHRHVPDQVVDHAADQVIKGDS